MQWLWNKVEWALGDSVFNGRGMKAVGAGSASGGRIEGKMPSLRANLWSKGILPARTSSARPPRRRDAGASRAPSDPRRNLCANVRLAATAAALALCLNPLAQAATFDPRAFVSRAVELIEQGRFAFARTWLDPAVVAQRLHPHERSHAYYLRGYSFQAQGLHVSAAQDYARALEFDAGNPAALVARGSLHFHGDGMRSDKALAFGFFARAAAAGDAAGEYHLGYAYLTGAGPAHDLEEARVWLERAAQQGHEAAMLQLAASYRKAFTDEPDPEQAQHWYERALEAGSAEAPVALGYMVRGGELEGATAAQATAYFKQGAQRGSGNGMANLAHAYLTGKGLEQDFDAARQWFVRAAALGAPGSFVGLGHVFEAGLGVTADAAEAMAWYRRGAEAGYSRPTLRLVRLLLAEGQEAEASRWLERVLAAGTAEALNGYAWLRATSRAAGVRNGELALAQAQQALALEPNAAHLDTLAAAYAELGQFDNAVATQREALTLAVADQGMVREMNLRLEAYSQGRPWRE